MARRAKPWWYSRDQQWAVTIQGQRYLLGPDKEAAENRFHELMAKPKMQQGSLWELYERYLQWLEIERAPLTLAWYKQHIGSFMDFLGDKRNMAVPLLRPEQVEKWLNSHKEWSQGYRRSAIVAVEACLNWGVKRQHLERNPIKGMIRKPPPGKREVVLSQTDFKRMLKHTTGDFRMLLIAAWTTGARPQELTKVCRRHVDLANARWHFPENEAKGRRERYVYLADKPLALTKKLMRKRTKGPLFRLKGKAWDRFTIANEFRKLEPKLGIKYRLYDMRHSFITNALKRGVDPITLQHLVGHKDLSMISKIYAKVQQDVNHMRQAAARAVQ